MPDFSLSIQDGNGTVWCWDKQARELLKIAVEKTAINAVPPDVLIKLLEKAVEPKQEV